MKQIKNQLNLMKQQMNKQINMKYDFLHQQIKINKQQKAISQILISHILLRRVMRLNILNPQFIQQTIIKKASKQNKINKQFLHCNKFQHLQMISESFLRNYSIKKILTAAQIQKEKLKVYYAKNIKQFFKRHDQRIDHLNKNNKPKEQIQVFYRYTVKHMKSDIFRDHHNLDQNQFYKGRPKAPIRCNEISLDVNPKAKSQQKENIQHFVALFSQPPERQFPIKRQSNRTATSSQIRTPVGFRKKPHCFSKTHCIEDSEILSLKLNELRMDTKMEEFQQQPKICLQNQQIVRCSTARKIDNFLLFREQALKKSASRGQKFRKTLRQKYAKLGVKKNNWTEMQNLQVFKN